MSAGETTLLFSRCESSGLAGEYGGGGDATGSISLGLANIGTAEAVQLPSGPIGLAANTVVLVDGCRVWTVRYGEFITGAGELSLLFIRPHCCGLYWPEKAAAFLEAMGELSDTPPGEAEYGEGL